MTLAGTYAWEKCGAATYLIGGAISLAGTIVRGLVSSRPTNSGTLSPTGSVVRASESKRFYPGTLSYVGNALSSIFAVGTYLASGAVTLAGTVARLAWTKKTQLGTLTLSGTLTWIKGVRYTAHLYSSGVVSWIVSSRAYAMQGILNLSGTIARWADLARTKTGVLNLAGYARAFIGGESIQTQASALSFAGVVSRSIIAARTKTGTLIFTQPEFGLDFWKEDLYYGIRNP